jgi:hypothetical protein
VRDRVDPVAVTHIVAGQGGEGAGGRSSNRHDWWLLTSKRKGVWSGRPQPLATDQEMDRSRRLLGDRAASSQFPVSTDCCNEALRIPSKQVPKRVAHPLSLGDESRGITANGHAMRPNHRKQGKRGSRSRTNLPDLTGTFKQALVFHRTGRLVDAERLYRSLHLLGVVYSQRDKHAEAVRKDPNVWGMKRVGIALNSGSGRGSESFLAASGMSIGQGEKSAGNFPRG